MIRTENLTKIFPDVGAGDTVAVDHINLHIKAGTIFGLLGPNGAGKTTALRMISTVLRPTEGRAWVTDLDVTEHPAEVRRRIGFMSGNTAVYDRMTAREMVEYFGRLHGMDESELAKKIGDIFDTFDMREFENRLCGKLSTGQKQKVSIARTIIHDPPVLVFDEPTTGLDVIVARTMLEFIRSCRRDDRVVIFSTHHMTEAERLCDEIAFIHEGRILASGTLDELKEQTEAPTLEDVFFKLAGEAGEADGVA
ncbi:MAG: ATP-binding cassette domain-containing protein [Planctomycetota bacterium]|nr:MAG: ATP-binding cassette domain-containing protein [Planctomycetota bacterium]